MNINLHIERLVLDGPPFEQRQGPHLQAAVEQELTRLLAANGLAQELHSGGATPQAHASGIQLADKTHPTWLGKQVAHCIYNSIRGTK